MKLRYEAVLYALRVAYIAGYENAPGRPRASEDIDHRADESAERLYKLLVSPAKPDPLPTPSKDENAA